MSGIFVVISLLIALGSFFFVSEITGGVYVLGWAVLLGAYARIAQAESHQGQLLSAVRERNKAGEESE